MPDQSHYWSVAANRYEDDFIDPYEPDARNPLFAALEELAGPKTAVDLGCGIGPLLPILERHFGRVVAVDFAEGMLKRARQHALEQGLTRVEFLQCSFTDLALLAGQVDVAVAVNSLVLPDLGELERALASIRATLRPGGHFLGIVPAMDSVHYLTMLLVDRARAAGMPPDKARQNAAHHGEHSFYDFAFSEFRFKGLQQHFWQPVEIRYRLRRAGFRRIRRAKVHMPWGQFPCSRDMKALPPPWDWFFHARAG